MKALNIEYAELLAAKKKAFTEYTSARAEMRKVLAVKANVEKILERDKNIETAIIFAENSLKDL